MGGMGSQIIIKIVIRLFVIYRWVWGGGGHKSNLLDVIKFAHFFKASLTVKITCVGIGQNVYYH